MRKRKRLATPSPSPSASSSASSSSSLFLAADRFFSSPISTAYFVAAQQASSRMQQPQQHTPEQQSSGSVGGGGGGGPGSFLRLFRLPESMLCLTAAYASYISPAQDNSQGFDTPPPTAPLEGNEFVLTSIKTGQIKIVPLAQLTNIATPLIWQG